MLKAWLPRKNQIAPVEIFAAVIAAYHIGPELTGKNVMFLIDSERAPDALIKGLSTFEDVILLHTAFWDLVAQFQMNAYLDRTSTDENISDGVSREDLSIAEACSWVMDQPSMYCLLGQGGPRTSGDAAERQLNEQHRSACDARRYP